MLKSMKNITITALALAVATFMCVLSLTVPAFAAENVDVVEIGEGTDTTRDVPFASDWVYGRTQSIYAAEDIGRSGRIESIAYDVATPASSNYKLEKLKIWIGYTNLDSYEYSKSGDINTSEYTMHESDVELVYSGKHSLKTAAGWDTIMLDTPFEYDASKGNLVIVATIKTGNSKDDMETRNSLTYRWTKNSDKYYSMYTGSMDNAGITELSYTGSEAWKPRLGYANIRFGFGESDVEYISVTFDADNGTNQVERRVEKNSQIVRPEDPVKEGCDFAGWFVGDNEFDFSTPITETITLKAKWTEKSSVDDKVDKTRLNAVIDSAKKDIDETSVSEDGSNVSYTSYYVSSEEKQALADAISAAQTVAGNSDATQAEVDNAYNDLSAAQNDFINARQFGKKNLPVIERVDYGSSPTQPAAGGVYKWKITFAEGVDYSKITDDYFKIQRKPHGENWKNSKCPVAFFDKDNCILEALAIPDNNAAGPNLWRFTFAGDVPGGEKSFPIITQRHSEQTVTVDLKPLEDAIGAARTAQEGISISSNGADVAASDQYVTEADQQALDDAIESAMAVLNNPNVKSIDVALEVSALNNAIDAYNAAKKNGTKNDASDNGAESDKDNKSGADEKDNPAEQKGKDGTAVGSGASFEIADAAITSSKSEEGPDGTEYSKLQLRSAKQANKSITLKWAKVKGAKKYVVYGNACGKKNRMKKLASTAKTSYNVKKISSKLKKGTYYKFIVVALDKNNRVLSTSKVVHASTKGGKSGNYKSVSVKKTVVNKAKKLKKGKTLKLNAKAVAASKKLKVKKHRVLSYESSNTKIATVSKKGVVKGKKKGTCYIYAYAQNGVFAKVKLTVK